MARRARRRRQSIFFGVVALLVTACLVAGLVYLLSTGGGLPKVPDVVGLGFREAARRIESAGLCAEVDENQDSSGARDLDALMVEWQDPKAGSEVEGDTIVTVHLKGLKPVAKKAGKPSGSSQEPPDSGQSPADTDRADTPPTTGSTGRTVCLDPGHSSGCPASEIDPATGLDVADNEGAAGERQAVWELTLRTRAHLESMGYRVILTKSAVNEYVSLRRRADTGNTADIVVRLHYDPDLHAVLHPSEGQFKSHNGSTVYVDPAVAKASERLAGALLPHLQSVGVTRMMNDCGGTSNNTGSAFVGSVLSRVPVVLIENDPSMVRDNPAGQDRVASALARGIDAYFKSL